MKKVIILTLLVLFLCGLQPLAAQEGSNPGLLPFYYSSTSKVLDAGVQSDQLFRLFYTKAMIMAGIIKFRSIKESENDEVWGINDSLLARDRKVYEVFLLPANWHFFRSGFALRAGAGLYYDYSSLKEKGYFNDSTLHGEPAGPDMYNAYVNEFTGHAFGPLLDTGLSWSRSFFSSSLFFGIVPAFYLNRTQTWKLSPYMAPSPSYTVASAGLSGPYYYLGFDMKFNFKYAALNLSLLNEYSVLKYTAAGFNEAGGWAKEDIKTENKVLAFEASLLLNLPGTNLKLQAGYGRTFDEVSGGGNYLRFGGMFGVDKIMF